MFSSTFVEWDILNHPGSEIMPLYLVYQWMWSCLSKAFHLFEATIEIFLELEAVGSDSAVVKK